MRGNQKRELGMVLYRELFMQKMFRLGSFDVNRSERQWFERLFRPDLLGRVDIRMVGLRALFSRATTDQQQQGKHRKASVKGSRRCLLGYRPHTFIVIRLRSRAQMTEVTCSFCHIQCCSAA